MHPPPERTHFVGREREIALLAASGTRLVTLVGPPGVGKTRLASHIVHEAGGAVWLDATELRTEADLRAAVAGALGVPPRGDVGRALAELGPVRLVLDGAERLEPAARDRLQAWVDEAPELRVLVTSVTRLGLEGEQTVELPPLEPDEAVALFEERARAAGAVIGPADRAAIAELIEGLDRVPLAIALAAARSPVLTPRQLLTRLGDRFRLLAAGDRSLRAAIAMAWDLLDPEAQRALAWCSVFRGGFDLDAAEGVLDVPDALAVLTELRERSLLQREGARFRLLESVRELAAEQLDALGEREEAEARHARWFLAAGERRASRVGTREDADVLAWLGDARGNLLAAFDRSRDPERKARLALVLHLVLALQGPTGEAVRVLDEALDELREPGPVRARLLRCRADIHLREGRLDRLRVCLDEALAMDVQEQPSLRAQLLAESGRARGQAGEYEAGRAELHDALVRCAELDESFLEAFAYNSLGVLEERAGDAAAAADAFERALEGFRVCGNVRMQGIAAMNLAVVRSNEGRLIEALDLHRRAFELLVATRDRAGEAAARLNLGHVHLLAGDLDEAEEAFRAGLAVERAIGQRDFLGLALGNLGIVAAARGELRPALAQLQQALDHYRAMGDRHFVACFLPFSAAVQAALGQVATARRDFDAARAELRSLGDVAHLDVVEVLEGFLDLAGPGDPDARRASAEARLDRPVQGDAIVARRLLEAAIGRFGGEATPSPAPERVRGEGLVIGPEARWFAVDGEPVDLARRGAIRRVLLALVDHRLMAPGVGLGVGRLYDAGWPGEKALPVAAGNRVYAAIRTLRRLGLGEVLLRRDDGYLLDPEVALHRG